MLESIGFASMEDLVESTVPHSIKLTQPIHLDKPLSESEVREPPFKYIHTYIYTYGYLLIEVQYIHHILSHLYKRNLLNKRGVFLNNDAYIHTYIQR